MSLVLQPLLTEGGGGCSALPAAVWDAAWLPRSPMSPDTTCTVTLTCSTFTSRAHLLPLSTLAAFSFLVSFWRGSGPPLTGSRAPRVGRVAQGLLQTPVETQNVPAQPPSPGTGQTREVLHPILSQPHWKWRWTCGQKTSGTSNKLTAGCAYAEACTGTAAWQMYTITT